MVVENISLTVATMHWGDFLFYSQSLCKCNCWNEPEVQVLNMGFPLSVSSIWTPTY